MENNHGEVFYLANMSPQLARIIPIYKKIGGYFITTHPYYEPLIKLNLKYGLSKCKITRNRDILYKKVRGILISQIATNSIPPHANYKRVYIGHSMGDKKFKVSEHKLDINSFDYYFITGPKELYRLEFSIDNVKELHKRCIRTGDLRSDYIINNEHKSNIVKKKYGITNNNTTILYGPTWKYGSGTLRKCFPIFANQISSKYNLIIRPHFKDKGITAFKRYIKKHKLKHIYYLDDPGLEISELFSISDIHIGDSSSVDYLFLFTKKPIISVVTKNIDKIKSPDVYDIRTISYSYNPDIDNINEIIFKALNIKDFQERSNKLINNCYYFNDGQAVNRTCEIIKGILNSNYEVFEKYKL